MKFTHYIYIATALAAFSACSDDVTTPTYTVGEADNAIVLQAGISEGTKGITTRADGGYDDIDASNHSKHVLFTTTANTKMALRVDGKWKGKADGTYTKGSIIKGTISSETVSQTTTATIKGESSSGSKHNVVEFSSAEQLYWDDYGTADPANTTSGEGRATGLTMYAAAVDGVTTAPVIDGTDGKKWTALSWNVGTPSTGSDPAIDQTAGWANYDLLTSNNVKSGGPDDTYKFDERSAGKLLEFTHSMTKITVNLTAGEGFPGYETSANDAKFQNEPKVTLLGFNYTGNVNIETKEEPTPSGSTTNIKACINDNTTWAAAHTAQATALVFPRNSFTATIGSDAEKTPTSSTEILKVEADGNIYYVTAAQLVKAIAKKEAEDQGNTLTSGDYTKSLLQGVNYVLKVTVNKTKIKVEATIKDWDEIEADNTAPEINIDASYGQTTSTTGLSAFDKSYDFFRSTSIATGYDEDNSASGINPAANFTYSSGSYTQSKVLYWPNHETHYFFRGVYPVIGTISTGLATNTNLAVTTVSSNDVIAVENVAYTKDTWPSDLAIALPRTTNTACTNHNKNPLENGICATKGTITMNFEYAMSKVEVRLKSSDNVTDPDYIDLSNITVEVVGGYNKGRIALKDGLHDTWVDSSDKGNYTLNQTTVASGFQKTTLDAIIPQTLGNDVKIKITVTNSDHTTDVYYAQLNLIKGKKAGAADSTKDFITEWKHGEYYIYTLDVRKTEIKVTATITDWVTVNADQPIWF